MRLASPRQLTAAYVDAHEQHFRFYFPQTVALGVLYAFASAGLLALGGWLVIQEQLSIGQLVAAELILSGAFYGISQMGSYVDDYYDLIAAVEELSLLYSIPQEPDQPARTVPLPPRGSKLEIAHVGLSMPAGPVAIDLEVEDGVRLVAQGSPGMERVLSNLLKRHLKPDKGLITIGGIDIGALDVL